MNQKSIRDKMIKRIMELEKKLFIPIHVPKGTPEDPDYPPEMGYREFTEEEKAGCWCPNCKYPFEYWDKKTDEELQQELAGLEELRVNSG